MSPLWTAFSYICVFDVVWTIAENASKSIHFQTDQVASRFRAWVRQNKLGPFILTLLDSSILCLLIFVHISRSRVVYFNPKWLLGELSPAFSSTAAKMKTECKPYHLPMSYLSQFSEDLQKSTGIFSCYWRFVRLIRIHSLHFRLQTFCSREEIVDESLLVYQWEHLGLTVALFQTDLTSKKFRSSSFSSAGETDFKLTLSFRFSHHFSNLLTSQEVALFVFSACAFASSLSKSFVPNSEFWLLIFPGSTTNSDWFKSIGWWTKNQSYVGSHFPPAERVFWRGRFSIWPRNINNNKRFITGVKVDIAFLVIILSCKEIQEVN